MKKFEDIYNSLIKTFFNKSKVDIAKGTVIDTFFYSIADSIYDIHKTIEKNKKPYLFTKQENEELDSTGYFLQCPRNANESDNNYFYRMQKWTQRNAASNLTSIDLALMNLEHCSSATYIPLTKGAGTATVIVIPKSYNNGEDIIALNEAKTAVDKVISPGSIVEYIVPNLIDIKLVAYLDIKENSDIENIKQNIIKDIKEYINSIAPKDKLMLGTINKIGMSYAGVEYFNVVQLYLNEEENTTFEITQTIKDKFIFDQIIWWEVQQ